MNFIRTLEISFSDGDASDDGANFLVVRATVGAYHANVDFRFTPEDGWFRTAISVDRDAACLPYISGDLQLIHIVTGAIFDAFERGDAEHTFYQDVFRGADGEPVVLKVEI